MYEAILTAVGFWTAEVTTPLPPLQLARALPSVARCEAALAEIAVWTRRCEDDWGASGGVMPGHLVYLAWQKWAWQHCRKLAARTGEECERQQALYELADYWGWRIVLSGEVPPPIPLAWYRER